MKLGGSMERRRGKGRRRAGQRSRGRKGRGKGAQTFWALLFGGILLSLSGSGVGYLFATKVLFPAPERDVSGLVEVPRVVGMDVSSARGLIVAGGLLTGPVDSLRHPTVPRGSVLGQSPLPGQLSVGQGEIRMTVSSGPEIRPVPDVSRLRADRAITVLEASGFQVLADSVESEMPQGRVISLAPSPETPVALPAEVQVLVSLGPPQVEMPDLVGMEEEEARLLLDSLGLQVGEVESRFRFGLSQSQVLEQDPPAGILVERGSAIRLVVGRRGIF